MMETRTGRSESANQEHSRPHVRVAARAHERIGFLAIFGAALSGFAGAGLWVVAASAIALVALSQAEFGFLYQRARDVGRSELANFTLAYSILNALIATSAAYAMGLFFRFI